MSRYSNKEHRLLSFGSLGSEMPQTADSQMEPRIESPMQSDDQQKMKTDVAQTAQINTAIRQKNEQAESAEKNDADRQMDQKLDALRRSEQVTRWLRELGDSRYSLGQPHPQAPRPAQECYGLYYDGVHIGDVFAGMTSDPPDRQITFRNRNHFQNEVLQQFRRDEQNMKIVEARLHGYARFQNLLTTMNAPYNAYEVSIPALPTHSNNDYEFGLYDPNGNYIANIGIRLPGAVIRRNRTTMLNNQFIRAVQDRVDRHTRH